jgi:pyruvate dehydrogenase E2 component (dihydrolipoamide acetyltransferase)
MPIELKMPALSPTMEEGTLAKWLKQEGDKVVSGDVIAEIETDKATMEFEAVDEGVIGKILVAEGTDEVKVGTVIAILLEEGEDASAVSATPAPPQQDAGETGAGQPAQPAPTPEPEVRGYGANPAEDKQVAASSPLPPAADGGGAVQSSGGDRVKASPLARRLAEQQNIDLSGLTGSGPGGRIVKADVDSAAG